MLGYGSIKAAQGVVWATAGAGPQRPQVEGGFSVRVPSSLALGGLVLALGLSACGSPAPIHMVSYGYGTDDPYGPTLGDPYLRPGYDFGPPVYENGPNTANPILQLLAPAVADVVPGQPMALTVSASHPKELPMAFAWAATGGTLSADAGKAVNWTPPTQPGTYVVTVVVTDQEGGLATGRMNLLVKGPNGELPAPAAPGANAAVGAGLGAASPGAGSQAAATPTPVAELARIEGLVTALPMKFLAGAEVLLVRADDEVKEFTARNTQSDASGRFKFEELPLAYRLKVVVRAAGLREGRIDITTQRATTARADFWGVKGLLPN